MNIVLSGHPDIDANMADNDNTGDDAHGFDNIDSSDSASDGDDSDFGGGGGSREYNSADSEFDGGGGGAVTILEYLNFSRERTNHMLLHPYHLLMTNQWMPFQLKCLVLLKICDKHDMQILLL